MQLLPTWIRLLWIPSWSWLETTNVKHFLLVKTSENFTSGNAFSIKLPTPQEELQGKFQRHALGGARGKCLTILWTIFTMMSVEYNYQKSFCIKYLLKFKNPTEVFQTIALIWTWKQFTEESWPQLFKRCGWHYPLHN